MKKTIDSREDLNSLNDNITVQGLRLLRDLNPPATTMNPPSIVTAPKIVKRGKSKSTGPNLIVKPKVFRPQLTKTEKGSKMMVNMNEMANLKETSSDRSKLITLRETTTRDVNK